MNFDVELRRLRSMLHDDSTTRVDGETDLTMVDQHLFDTEYELALNAIVYIGDTSKALPMPNEFWMNAKRVAEVMETENSSSTYFQTVADCQRTINSRLAYPT